MGSYTQLEHRGGWVRLRWNAFLLGGYLAFNLPRTVTTVGTALLAGLAAIHGYVVATEPEPPIFFIVYCGALILGSALAAGLMWLNLRSRVPEMGWFLGSAVCAVFFTVYPLTRIARLAGLPAITGRWDFAPGTLALACAAAFLALHVSVLLGVNVAFGQQRTWHD